MKKMTIVRALSILLLLGTFFVVQAFAEGAKGQTGQKGTMAATEKGFMTHRASQIIGKDVYNMQGEKLGSIADLYLSREGKVDFLILSHGGVLGVADRFTPIPWDFAKAGFKEDRAVLNLNRQQVENAPHFAGRDWRVLEQPDWNQKVYSYYRREMRTSVLMGTGQTMAAGESREMGSMATEKGFMTHRASQIIGKDVYGQRGEKLGSVKDLYLSREGKVDFLILSHGGVLGIADRFTPIPWDFAKAGFQEDRLVVNLNRQQLENAPHFAGRNWRVLEQPDWSQKVYSYYSSTATSERG